MIPFRPLQRHGGVTEIRRCNEDDILLVNGREINVYLCEKPCSHPLGDYGVDIVIESTGLFVQDTFAAGHLKAEQRKLSFPHQLRAPLRQLLWELTVNH